MDDNSPTETVATAISSLRQSWYGKEDPQSLNLVREYYYDPLFRDRSSSDGHQEQARQRLTDLPWSVRLRVWLRLYGSCPLQTTMIPSSIHLLQSCLADLQAVLVQEGRPIGTNGGMLQNEAYSTQAMEEDEQEEDFLLQSLVQDPLDPSNTNVSNTHLHEDTLLTLWAQHQRYFFLQDVRVIWINTSIEKIGDANENDIETRILQQGRQRFRDLLRAIVRGIDRLLLYQAPLPEWMLYRESVLKRPESTWTVALHDWIREYTIQRGIDVKGPIPFYECFGRQGGRGTMALQLCHFVLNGQLDNANVQHFLERVGDKDVVDRTQSMSATLYERRGKALVSEIFRHLLPPEQQSRHSKQIESPFDHRTPVSSLPGTAEKLLNESIFEQMSSVSGFDLRKLLIIPWERSQFLLNQSLNGNMDDLADDKRRLLALFGDWFPFTMLLEDARTILASNFGHGRSLEERKEATVKVLSSMNLFLIWIRYDSDWISLWGSYFWGDMDNRFSLLFRYVCVASDYATVKVFVDCSLLICCHECLIEGMRRFKCLDPNLDLLFGSCSSTVSLLSMYSEVYPALDDSGIPDNLVRSIDSIQQKARSLIPSSWSFGAVCQEPFLRSVLSFCEAESKLNAPNFGRAVISAYSSQLITMQEREAFVSTWVKLLIEHLLECQLASKTSLPPILRTVHTEICTQFCPTSSGRSIVALLLDANPSGDIVNDVLDCAVIILKASPPESLFQGATSSIYEIFRLAMERFKAPAVPSLFLGLAVWLDANDIILTNEIKQQCLKLARAFLLAEFQRPTPSDGWSGNVVGAVDAELRARASRQGKDVLSSAGVAWWNQVCLDLKTRHIYTRDEYADDMARLRANIELATCYDTIRQTDTSAFRPLHKKQKRDLTVNELKGTNRSKGIVQVDENTSLPQDGNQSQIKDFVEPPSSEILKSVEIQSLSTKPKSKGSDTGQKPQQTLDLSEMETLNRDHSLDDELQQDRLPIRRRSRTDLPKSPPLPPVTTTTTPAVTTRREFLSNDNAENDAKSSSSSSDEEEEDQILLL